MKMIGLARVGHDVDVRFTATGQPVANVSLAFNYHPGIKTEDGKNPTQWIRATLWGKRAESLAPYLKKGSSHCFTLSDVHVEIREADDGKVHSNLVARVDDVQLGNTTQETRPAPRQEPESMGSEDIPF
jgi:single-strand DNA-binding protein